MHEMGIADAMLRTVTRIARDEGVARVTRITVEIGELSGVVPRFLSDCWEAVAAGTVYEATALVVSVAPGTLRCLECGSEFPVDFDRLRCPNCGSEKLAPIAGRDLTILEIEAE